MSERTVSERGEQSGSDGAARLHAAQEEEFRALANQWHRETDHHSSTSIIQSHAALQKIVRMGAPAVPLILRELNEGRDGHWFQALRTSPERIPWPRTPTTTPAALPGWRGAGNGG